MSVATALYATLAPLVANRCYPNEFPQTSAGVLPAWPAIRYSLIGADHAPSLCGTGGEDGDTTTVQLDLVARDYTAAATLRAQVIAAMQTLDPPSTREGAFEQYDAETKTHRVTLQYQVHASTE